MLKALWLIVILFTFSNCKIALGQSTRSLSGTVTLDLTPSEIDRDIEISVRNHSFVVIPPNFQILRPITSRESSTVKMLAGTTQVNYLLENIIIDPVDYSISIRCIGCSIDMPDQFYTSEGNAFSLINSAYIDPLDLPNTLDLTAITRAEISGEITLDKIATRDLLYTLTVFSAENRDRIFATLSPITIASGTTSTSYSVTGLNRAIGSDRYRIKIQCINCIGQARAEQVFIRALSPNQNHSQIDFSVIDIPIPVIAPILELLLN